MFAPTPLNVAIYVDALIVSILWTYCFIVMINQRLNAEMKEAKEHFELIFNTSPDAVVITRPDDGMIVNINDGFTELCGFTRDESVGKSSLAINIWENPEDRQKVVGELNEKGFCDNYEAVFRRRDGSRLIGIMSAKIINIQGVPHIISVTRDITKRKEAEDEIRSLNTRLEERVAERTIKIESLNRELEEFTYSVAHTMRSPLRALDGFSGMIIKKYSDRLGAEGNRLINVIRSSSNEINTLITEMLEFLRVSLNKLKFSKIDMTELVNKVYHDTVPAEYRDKFIFSVKALPEAVGDPDMVKDLWGNLISNAVKYTLPREERVIEIGSGSVNGVDAYYIKDTGVGFDSKYRDNLFGLFNRLHRVEDFEGIGIGLAVVERIVSRHGGRVWAEGKVGEGATFYFTLSA
jgi:PAS domain S-box-containing protein